MLRAGTDILETICDTCHQRLEWKVGENYPVEDCEGCGCVVCVGCIEKGLFDRPSYKCNFCAKLTPENIPITQADLDRVRKEYHLYGQNLTGNTLRIAAEDWKKFDISWQRRREARLLGNL